MTARSFSEGFLDRGIVTSVSVEVILKFLSRMLSLRAMDSAVCPRCRGTLSDGYLLKPIQPSFFGAGEVLFSD